MFEMPTATSISRLVRFILSVCLLSVSAHTPATAEVIRDLMSDGGRDWIGWSFVGDTAYAWEQQDGGTWVLDGQAASTASALGVEVRLYPQSQTRLAWSWRVLEYPGVSSSERSQEQDDFALRIYLVNKRWYGLLGTRTLVYAWSQHEPPGSIWPNPFTDQARMIAVQPESASLGIWHAVERNWVQDWQEAFGDIPDRIDAVAVMVDADNSETTARGQIRNLRILP